MFLELVQDYPVLVPGEVIEHVPTGRRVVVYPAGLHHVARMPGFYSAAKAAIDEPAATAMLLGDAFPLLAACCAPPLTERTGALAELAAASWLRQSADRAEPDPRDEPSDGKRHPPPSFAEVLSTLLAAGHRVADVLHRPVTGVDGRPLPYTGWTVPLLDYHWRAAVRAQAAQRAEAMSVTMSAVVGTFGDDEGRDAVGESLRRLRAFAAGPAPRAPAAVVSDEPGVSVGNTYAVGTFERMASPPRPGQASAGV